MYMPLLIGLIAGGVFLVGLAAWIIPLWLCNYYDDKSTVDEQRCRPNEYWRKRFADNPALFEKQKKYYQRYSFWYKAKERFEVTKGAITAISCTMCIIFLLIGFLAPLSAQKKVAYWSNFSVMANEVLMSSDSMQSIGMADKIIAYNTWLAKVRAEKQIFGNWSEYYNIDLDSLEYITFNNKAATAALHMRP